jgi:hypothetical protein
MRGVAVTIQSDQPLEVGENADPVVPPRLDNPLDHHAGT